MRNDFGVRPSPRIFNALPAANVPSTFSNHTSPMSRFHRRDESDSDSEDRSAAAAANTGSSNLPAPSLQSFAQKTAATARGSGFASGAHESVDLLLASDSDEDEAVERRATDITANAKFETGSNLSTSDRLVANPRPADASDWQSNASSPHRCALSVLLYLSV